MKYNRKMFTCTNSRYLYDQIDQMKIRLKEMLQFKGEQLHYRPLIEEEGCIKFPSPS